MSHPHRRPTPRRRHLRSATGTAVLALLAVLALPLVPGTAAASTTGIGTVPTGTITPLLDCITKSSDGSVTAVLGYTNASTTTATIAVGQLNQLSPARFTGRQPTTFQPGTHRGVLSLTLTSAEYMNGAYWWVDGNVVYFDWPRTQTGPYCAAGTTLPATGNGTGTVIGLLVAGAAGVLVLRRARRSTAPGPVAAG